MNQNNPPKTPESVRSGKPDKNIEGPAHGKPEVSVDSILSRWRNRDRKAWQKSPSHYLQAGLEMLSAGEPLLAYDILTEGVETMGGLAMLGELEGHSPETLVHLLQQQALALAQSGASEDANVILQALHEKNFSDSETLGIMGRTWKDIAMATRDENKKKNALQKAFECYHSSFSADSRSRKNGSAYYTGINAATVSLLSGNEEQSRNIAEQVMDICAAILADKPEAPGAVSFWLYASMGEASLLMNDLAAAEEWYQKAVANCTKDIRALGSMRRQARLILAALGQGRGTLDHCFPVPSVILFSGHMIDHQSNHAGRFPAENEKFVRTRIREWLDDKNGLIGYSSAACGADIIFLEEMLSRGGEINIVLPYEQTAFLQTSVSVVLTGNWAERFAKLLEKANEVKVLSQYSEHTLDDDLLFANLYLFGTAQVRAERAGTDLKTLLVWDGNGSGSLAGTAALADLLKRKENPFDIVSPTPLTQGPLNNHDTSPTPAISLETGSTSPVTVGKQKAYHHSFLPLLIADVKGYSRLDKREKLLFASNFMGEMATALEDFGDMVFGRKTQGDGLFLVFNSLQACVESAKALTERTEKTDWKTFGLSHQLTMRISLDAGPCYSFTDPITSQRDFCGDYIVRAARLEPVTPPGNIYASETFVAVAKALGVQDIKFDYAGQVELPKGYGRMQAFHVK